MFRKTIQIIIILYMLIYPVSSKADDNLRVGVYNFQPLVFIDEHGKPEGFFIDILNHIAEKEGWNLVYVPGSWNDCLNRLKNREIDLLVSIAYSEERARYFDFTRNHLFLLWAEVYARKTSVETLFDLQGKTVGALRKAQATAEFKTLLDQFGVTCQIKEYPEYASVFQAVKNRAADAGICTNIYGIKRPDVQALHRTRIIFAPTKVRFAVKKGTRPDILGTLDRYFTELQAQKDSLYYRAYDKWMVPLADDKRFRRMIQIGGVLFVFAIISLLLMIVINRRLHAAVEARTSELQIINQDLRDREKALAESEEKFYKAFHSCPVTMSISTIDEGIFLDVNKEFLKITGFTRQEVIGKKSSELDLWYDKNFRDEIMSELKQRGRVHNKEVKLKTKSGKIRYLLWFADVVNISKQTCLIVTGYDLTELKHVENVLKESEESFRNICENVPIGMFQSTPAGQLIHVNPMISEMLGYDSPAEVIRTVNQTSIADALYEEPEKRPLFVEEVENAQGNWKVFENRYKRKDGRIIDAILSFCERQDPITSKQFFYGFVQDITERKHAAELLELERKRFFMLLEMFPGYIYLQAPDYSVHYANRYFKEYFGDPEGQLCYELLHDRKEPCEVCPTFKVFETKTPQVWEWNQTSDGSVYLIYDYPFIDSNGSELVLEIGADITALKDAEDKLREYSERLEKMVEERTRELKKAQDELLLNERLAVLGHFAGSISHEIRNPLAVIDSSVFFLKMKLDQNDEKIREHLERISGNVKKSTAIIESLLNLTRMEKPKAETCDLTEIIREALRSSRVPDTTEVLTAFPGEPVLIRADREQIRMALKNIIRNAVQAMHGTGELDIRVRVTEAGEAEVVISDTGPGISQENPDKIFEPLFTTRAQGIGFGLSITRMIAENHGGTVRAESEPGKGAVFTLALTCTCT